jgi:hypothetical protein
LFGIIIPAELGLTHDPNPELDVSVALAAGWVPRSGMNYAVKSRLLLSFLESVPEVSAKLKTPKTTEDKFESAVKSVQDAAALVLVY